MKQHGVSQTGQRNKGANPTGQGKAGESNQVHSHKETQVILMRQKTPGGNRNRKKMTKNTRGDMTVKIKQEILKQQTMTKGVAGSLTLQ